MKFYVGKVTDELKGTVTDKYLIMGKLIKDPEFKTVGAKGTNMLKFVVSPGHGEDLCALVAWGQDAMDFSLLRKGSIVIADTSESINEYNGKTYRNYNVFAMIAMGGAAMDRGSVNPELSKQAADIFSEIDGSMFS